MNNNIEIESQLQKFIKAFADLNFSQLEPLFSNDATAFFGKGVNILNRIDGKENILKIFETYFKKKKAEGKKDVKINPLNKITQDFGDTAIVTFELDDSDNFWRRRTFVLRKHQNTFLIVHLHSSTEEIQVKGFSLIDIYDKLCKEGGYFNYPLIADILSTLQMGRTEVLELCIGTGNVALLLAEKGFKITGIDEDPKMLELLAAKSNANKITLAQPTEAHIFNIEKEFDAIYIHSGHLIFNKNGNELYLNIINYNSMIATFQSVKKHLKNSGLFIINIERWNYCTIKLLDGTIFQRTIFKETDKEGKRFYTFFDGASPEGKVHQHPSDLNTKISYESVKSELTELGFSNFTNHLDTFIICTLNNK